MGSTVQVRFFLNHFAFDAAEGEAARLTFTNCSLWRLGHTNDEGWYSGQCRYSETAPKWGEFCELTGFDEHRFDPADWQRPQSNGTGVRHFLFYFRDETFECFADAWTLQRDSEMPSTATSA